MSFSIKLDQDTHITLPFSIRMTAIEFGRHWNLVKELQTFDLWITIKWIHCKRTVVGQPISQAHSSSQEALSLSAVRKSTLYSVPSLVPCLPVHDEGGDDILIRIHSNTLRAQVGVFLPFSFWPYISTLIQGMISDPREQQFPTWGYL